MPLLLHTGFRFPVVSNPFAQHKRFNFYRNLTLEMGTSKRPICLSCSKPILLCLCSRFKTPLFDNSISVTILQHNQEKNHPLNSTRIATLGLKNLTLATVSDVHLEAKFLIKLLKPGSIVVGEKSNENDLANVFFERVTEPQEAIFGSNAKNQCENFDTHVEICLKNEENRGKRSSNFNLSNIETCQNHLPKPNSDQIERNPTTIGEEEPDISATISKCGFTCSLVHLRTLKNSLEKPDFDQLLASQVGQDAISNGFTVRKLRKKQLDGIFENEDSEEYNIVVPPGSALLFPTKKSINVEDVDFEIKHLIVLDGTWGKAKRMYHENPWLKMLPHLKLNLNKASLYSEVRQQPNVGCLSTIESIVCAMKALGDDSEELDNLLDVFESMVIDQRRCKDERLSKLS